MNYKQVEITVIFDDGTEYLKHFGVPGMKWGVRNERELKGRRSGSKQALNNVREKASIALTQKKLSSAGKQKILKKASPKTMQRIKKFLGLSGAVAASVAINAIMMKMNNDYVKNMIEDMIDSVVVLS